MEIGSASVPQLPGENQEALSAYYGPTNFTWLLRGRLGGMPRPGLSRPFERDAEALLRLGIDMVVTLTEEWEPPVERFTEFGMDSVYVPIPDMEPPTMHQAIETCEIVADALGRGQSIAMHCRAGRGRTGTLLAATLIWYQPDFDAVIERVKSTNRYWIESSSQMEFLVQFSAERQRMLGVANGNRRRKGGISRPALDWRNKWPETAVSPNQPEKPEGDFRATQSEGSNMSLDKALQTAMSGIPECLASGYVDMDSGMLLGVQTIDSHPQEVLDLLSAATADLFQGASIVNIEDIFKQARGTKSDGHYFNEILVFSENLIHVFMRTKAYPAHVCAFICRKSANPGMVLTKARMSLEKVTAAL